MYNVQCVQKRNEENEEKNKETHVGSVITTFGGLFPHRIKVVR